MRNPGFMVAHESQAKPLYLACLGRKSSVFFTRFAQREKYIFKSVALANYLAYVALAGTVMAI
jgi:hypothetical protein